MTKHDKEFYRTILDSKNKDIDVWKDKYFRLLTDTAKSDTMLFEERGKNDILENLLSDVLKDKEKPFTSKFIILNGIIYEMTDYDLHHNDIEADNLDAHFVRVSDKHQIILNKDKETK